MARLRRSLTLTHMPGRDLNEELREASAMGDLRCENESSMDAPILMPEMPEWAHNRRQLLRDQMRTLGGSDAVIGYYVELLVRAKALMDFIQDNVGPSEDWPISMMGESEGAEDCMTEALDRLAAAVGCLTEL